MFGAEPDPTPIDDIVRIDVGLATGWYLVVLILGVLLYTSLMAWLFTKVLIRSAAFPSPHALTTSLTLLTFVALTAAIATDSAALETIAATGMGAIAGALSHVFTEGRNERKQVSEQSDSETEADVPELPDSEE